VANQTAWQDAKAANNDLELRQRELKEQIKKMRFSKSGDNNVEANAA
jgi:serine/arginine repetitive matrix protein 1